jgi:hypothetical protein
VDDKGQGDLVEPGVGQGFTRVGQALSGSPVGRAVAPTLDGLKQTAQGLYRAAEAAGGILDQAALGGLASRVGAALRNEGYNPRLHPRVQVALDELDDLSQAPASIARLDLARRVAGNVAQSVEPDERRLAGLVIEHMDDLVDGMAGGDAVRAARNVWGRMRCLEAVEEIITRAGNAKDGGFLTAVASGFRSLLNNPRARRGFGEAELAAMQQIARGGGGVAQALGGLGKVLGINSPSGLAAMGGALYQAGAMGVLSPIAGAVARAGSDALRGAEVRAIPAMVGMSPAERAALEAALGAPNALAAFVPAAGPATGNALSAYAGPR